MKVKGKGIAPLIKTMRVKVRMDVVSGLEVFNTDGIAGNEFDVIALGIHTYEDRSTIFVAFLDVPMGIREVALQHLIVVSKE